MRREVAPQEPCKKNILNGTCSGLPTADAYVKLNKIGHCVKLMMMEDEQEIEHEARSPLQNNRMTFASTSIVNCQGSGTVRTANTEKSTHCLPESPESGWLFYFF